MLAAALVAFAGASTAQAETTSFRPVETEGRALIFEPSGVETETIESGQVSYHYRKHVRRRLHRRDIPHTHRQETAVEAIREAVDAGSTLRVEKAHQAKTGKLTVVSASSAPGPAPLPGNCSWGTFSASNMPGSCWRPFSNSSPFNRALPSRVSQVTNSPAVGSRTATFGAGAPVVYGGVADTSSDYSHSLYYSRQVDPLYTVHCTKSWGTCDVEGAQVRIPNAARATGGGDGHMGVIDQQSGVEYDFWQVLQKPSGGGTLTVSWGGKTAIGTPDATGLGSKAVAAGYALSAGVIRPEELAAGQINHALFMTVKCTNGTSVYPSGRNTGRVCSELGLSNENAPAMGSHFYLDLSPAQIEGLSLPAWKKAILRAMATYGMFVGDTGASYNGWTLEFQSGTSYTSMGLPDPWVGLGKRFGVPTWQRPTSTQYLFDLRSAVDWQSKLRVAQPCVAQGTC